MRRHISFPIGVSASLLFLAESSLRSDRRHASSTTDTPPTKGASDEENTPGGANNSSKSNTSESATSFSSVERDSLVRSLGCDAELMNSVVAGITGRARPPPQVNVKVQEPSNSIKHSRPEPLQKQKPLEVRGQPKDRSTERVIPQGDRAAIALLSDPRMQKLLQSRSLHISNSDTPKKMASEGHIQIPLRHLAAAMHHDIQTNAQLRQRRNFNFKRGNSHSDSDDLDCALQVVMDAPRPFNGEHNSTEEGSFNNERSANLVSSAQELFMDATVSRAMQLHLMRLLRRDRSGADPATDAAASAATQFRGTFVASVESFISSPIFKDTAMDAPTATRVSLLFLRLSLSLFSAGIHARNELLQAATKHTSSSSDFSSQLLSTVSLIDATLTRLMQATTTRLAALHVDLSSGEAVDAKNMVHSTDSVHLRNWPTFSPRQLSVIADVVSECATALRYAVPAKEELRNTAHSSWESEKRDLHVGLLLATLSAYGESIVGQMRRPLTKKSSALQERQASLPPSVEDSVTRLCERLWKAIAPPLEHHISDRLVAHTTPHASLNIRLAKLQHQLPTQNAQGTTTRDQRGTGVQNQQQQQHGGKEGGYEILNAFSWMNLKEAVLLLHLFRWVVRLRESCFASSSGRSSSFPLPTMRSELAYQKRSSAACARLCRCVLEVEADVSFLALECKLRGNPTKAKRTLYAVPTQIDAALFEGIAGAALIDEDGDSQSNVSNKELNDVWVDALQVARLVRYDVSSLVYSVASRLVKSDLAVLSGQSNAGVTLGSLSVMAFVAQMRGSLFPLLRRHYMLDETRQDYNHGTPAILTPCLDLFVLLKSVADAHDALVGTREAVSSLSERTVDANGSRSGGTPDLVCGVPLSQAMEVAYFLAMYMAAGTNVDPLAQAVDSVDCQLVTHETTKVYVSFVMHALDGNTARLLWHLRNTQRILPSATTHDDSAHKKDKRRKIGTEKQTLSPRQVVQLRALQLLLGASPKTSSKRLLKRASTEKETVSPSTELLTLQRASEDPASIIVEDSLPQRSSSSGTDASSATEEPATKARHQLRDAASVLSVVHAHIMHPSFYWMPLMQVQEWLFILSRYPDLLSRRTNQPRHRMREGEERDLGRTSTEATQVLEQENRELAHVTLPVTRGNRKANQEKALPIADSDATKNEAAVALEELLISSSSTDLTRKVEEGGAGATATPSPQSASPTVQQRHFARAHGYLVLRLHVISRAVREYKRLCRLAVKGGKGHKKGKQRKEEAEGETVRSLGTKEKKEAAGEHRTSKADARSLFDRAVQDGLSSPSAGDKAASTLVMCYPTLAAVSEGFRLPLIPHTVGRAVEPETVLARQQLRETLLRGNGRVLRRLESTVQLAVKHSLLFNVMKDRQKRRAARRAGSAEALAEGSEVGTAVDRLFKDVERDSEESSVSNPRGGSDKIFKPTVIRVSRDDAAKQALGFSIDATHLTIRSVKPKDAFAEGLRAAGLTAADAAGKRITHINDTLVQRAEDIVSLTRGKSSFTVTFRQKDSNA